MTVHRHWNSQANEVDSNPGSSYPQIMEVHFSPDVESKLTRLATLQGTDGETIVVEAVERLVNYDEWFRAEVQTGLAQIERGQTLSHEDAGTRLDAYLTTRQRPA
jgi:predicted transcriptional regulator